MTIVTGKKIQSNKIETSVQPGKSYRIHHIIIHNKKDLDEEIEHLIRESYNYYLERERLKKQNNPGPDQPKKLKS